MNYKYKFEKINPENLFVQVKYSAEGHPDQFKNFVVDSLDKQNLKNLAEGFASVIIQTWQNIEAAPNEVDFEGEEVEAIYVAPVDKPVFREEIPAYDFFTEKVEEVTQETETEITISYVKVPLTETEIQEIISEWRLYISATMRQARLALKQQGLLATVQSNIDALPEDSQIEWEYAGSVERNSPLVQSLGAALGLSDEDLDNLFKLAITL